jgi:hypothetical protein
MAEERHLVRGSLIACFSPFQGEADIEFAPFQGEVDIEFPPVQGEADIEFPPPSRGGAY